MINRLFFTSKKPIFYNASGTSTPCKWLFCIVSTILSVLYLRHFLYYVYNTFDTMSLVLCKKCFRRNRKVVICWFRLSLLYLETDLSWLLNNYRLFAVYIIHYYDYFFVAELYVITSGVELQPRKRDMTYIVPLRRGGFVAAVCWCEFI